MRRWAGWVVIWIAAVIGCHGAMAHPAFRCAAHLQVNETGHATMSVRFDILSFVLNEEPRKASDDAIWQLVDGTTAAADEALTSASKRFERHVNLQADGVDVPGKLMAFPDGAAFERWKKGVSGSERWTWLPWLSEGVVGFAFSERTHEITVQLPEVLGDLVLMVEVPGAEARAISLKAGERSPVIVLGKTEAGMSGAQRTNVIRAEASGKEHGFLSFVRMGVEHIVPEGLDHMLFIIGLFLASPRVKSLLVMVTMFTLAHSVTLALAATGIVVAPPRVIEPLIALSIAAVAIENILTRPKKADGGQPQGFSFRQNAVRAAIVFAFGLVHGLGFASAFKEMELPRSVLVPALVGFNVGVEVGQLLVLTCAFVVIGWAGGKSWYRNRVVIPGSVAIACVGLYWAVTRVI